MISSQFAEGDPVRITFGTYKGAEGVIEDLQPECSAVRILTKTGRVYALLGAMQKLGQTVRTPPKGSILKKK